MVFEGLNSALDYLFNTAMTNINFLRVLVAIIIISLIYNSLYNVFGRNKAAALVVSLIVALIGVRFMPSGLLLQLSTFIWLFVLFAVPYLLVRRLFRKGWHAVAAALLAAVVLAYLLQDYILISFGLFAVGFGLPGFLEDLYYKVADSPSYVALVISAVIVIIFVIWFLFKKRPVE